MAAKQLIFDEAGAAGVAASGVEKLSRAVVGHARPERPQRGPRQKIRLPDGHQGRRDGRQGNRTGRPLRKHGRPDGPRSRQQDQRHRRRRHHHGDGSGRGDLSRRPEVRHRRRQPDLHPARHQQGRRSRRRAPRQDLQEGQGQGRDQAGRDRFRQLGHDDRRNHRRRDGQGRQGRHDHGRRSEVHRDHARRGRRHAVRQGLSLAVLRDQRRNDGSEARRRLHPDLRKEDQQPEGPAADCSRRSPRPASRC